MIERVYVAGPLTPRGMRSDTKNAAVEYLYNVRDMVRIGEQLVDNGYCPYIPGLDFPLFMFGDINEDKMYRNSMAWLEVSDAVLLLPYYENSTGVIKEIERARELGIPIFGSVSQLNEYVQEKNREINRARPADCITAEVGLGTDSEEGS